MECNKRKQESTQNAPSFKEGGFSCLPEMRQARFVPYRLPQLRPLQRHRSNRRFGEINQKREKTKRKRNRRKRIGGEKIGQETIKLGRII